MSEDGDVVVSETVCGSRAEDGVIGGGYGYGEVAGVADEVRCSCVHGLLGG